VGRFFKKLIYIILQLSSGVVHRLYTEEYLNEFDKVNMNNLFFEYTEHLEEKVGPGEGGGPRSVVGRTNFN